MADTLANERLEIAWGLLIILTPAFLETHEPIWRITLLVMIAITSQIMKYTDPRKRYEVGLRLTTSDNR